jgi:hypothetical protein
VQVQVVEPELLELEDIAGEAGLDFVELEVVELEVVELEDVELLDGLGAAVKRHEQAEETLDARFEQ